MREQEVGSCEKGEKNTGLTDSRRQNHHGMEFEWKRREGRGRKGGGEGRGRVRRGRGGVGRKGLEGRSGKGGEGRKKKGREGREERGREDPHFMIWATAEMVFMFQGREHKRMNVF